MEWSEPIDKLKGIGPKRAKSLAKAGIKTVGGLLELMPSSYEDKTRLGSFGEEVDWPISIKAKILERPKVKYIGNSRTLVIAPVIDEKGFAGEVLFFNQPYLASQLTEGSEFIFYGRVNYSKKTPQLASPKYAPIGKAAEFMTITPIYKKIEGIPPAALVKAIDQALKDAGEIPDFLPERLQRRYGLVSAQEMFQGLHAPKSKMELNRAKLRLKFNEGLKINMGVMSNKIGAESTDIVITNFESVTPFINSLPFELTGGQEWALHDVFRDLESGKSMNRMIEGDVGSGKTIVAVICAYLMSINGLQTAYMAPTEILAKQHAETFREYLEPYGITTGLLVGSQNPKEAEEVRRRLRRGEIQVVVGTHALFQENTDFYNLGLIVTDEQHRFGVRQRGRFGQKGNAHTLVMSATPIPRTLALTYFGDLDLSVINELPEGRRKVRTFFFTMKRRNDILEFMEKEINKGHQAFVVCPFVDESEAMTDVVSVEKAYKEIRKFAGGRFKVGMLHGKLTAPEKEAIVKDFNDGKIDLLVATSIIEVGINVPNVSVITVFSADRFGLSQLHQLRGRTGRSDIQSYCFLVSDNTSEQTVERMKIIVNCHDGHEIAMADLKIRGPGDYFGFSQHGYGNLKFIDPIKDAKLFEQTKDAAEEVFKSPKAEDMLCKDALLRAFNEDMAFVTMN